MVRAAALNRAWRDPAIDGIIAVRGGYGSVQLLPLLDPELPRRHPKVFIGYSDITTLHMWLGQQGQIAFQGPMIEGRLALGAERYDRDAFVRAIIAAEPAWRAARATARDDRIRRSGRPDLWRNADPDCGVARHALRLRPAARAACCFWKTWPSGPYRLDRLLTQLRLAGILSRAVAIVLGHVSRLRRARRRPHGAGDARVAPARSFPGPVVFGLPVGHVDGPALTLPLGVMTRVIGGPSSSRHHRRGGGRLRRGREENDR